MTPSSHELANQTKRLEQSAQKDLEEAKRKLLQEKTKMDEDLRDIDRSLAAVKAAQR